MVAIGRPVAMRGSTATTSSSTVGLKDDVPLPKVLLVALHGSFHCGLVGKERHGVSGRETVTVQHNPDVQAFGMVAKKVFQFLKLDRTPSF